MKERFTIQTCHIKGIGKKEINYLNLPYESH